MITRAVAVVLLGLGLAGCDRTQHKSENTTSRGPDSMSAMPGMKAMPGRVSTPASASGSVHLTADQIRQFGVTFGAVERRPLETEVRTVGTVMTDETRQSQIVPKVGGYVERLYVNETGQRVHRGELLVAVYSPDVVAAEGELLVAARLGDSSLVDAGKRRLRAWDVSDEQIARVLRSGTVERTVTSLLGSSRWRAWRQRPGSSC